MKCVCDAAHQYTHAHAQGRDSQYSPPGLAMSCEGACVCPKQGDLLFIVLRLCGLVELVVPKLYVPELDAEREICLVIIRS